MLGLTRCLSERAGCIVWSFPFPLPHFFTPFLLLILQVFTVSFCSRPPPSASRPHPTHLSSEHLPPPLPLFASFFSSFFPHRDTCSRPPPPSVSRPHPTIFRPTIFSPSSLCLADAQRVCNKKKAMRIFLVFRLLFQKNQSFRMIEEGPLP